MKLVAALGAVGLSMLVGCAGAQKAEPKSAFELAEQELAHTIGTTTVTSAPVDGARAKPLFDGADDVYPAPAPVVETWGAPAPVDPDLAKNPYDPN
ncbi:MAG: hypothetical protein KF819_17965 [Labilithrix sp.]|nr:hypothetical protein [Labilithrix sp.]